MARILVTGGNNGLGAAIIEALTKAEHVHQVYSYDLEEGYDVREPYMPFIDDITFLDVLINCAGVNDIGWLDNFTGERWDEVMDTNAKGIFMMSQACYPKLRQTNGTIVNIVSNAAHMPMRCSAAYNASKGAALILSKQLAREMSPHVTVFSVSPNKLKGTEMSKQIDQQVCETRGWTMEEAQQYQNAGLLTGRETPPHVVAELIAYLLFTRERHMYLAGCDIQYGA